MLLLIASAVISLALQEFAEGIAILVTVIINASIATYTEKSSGDALAALLKMTSPTVKVKRRGVAGPTPLEAAESRDPTTQPALPSTMAVPAVPHGQPAMDLEAAKSSELEELDSDASVIPSRELVVGDLVLLESGNVIPADVRLLHCTDCRVDEAMLTGESMDVQKNHLWRPTADGKEQLSPPNMLFSGQSQHRTVAQQQHRTAAICTAPSRR